MSEYTPTEARICIDFCNAATKRAQSDGSFMSMEDADAAFSRWLAAHDAEVLHRAALFLRGSENPRQSDNTVQAVRHSMDDAGYELLQLSKRVAIGAGVVAEEPEWEYGVGWTWNEFVYAFSTGTRDAAEEHIERHPEDPDFGPHFLVHREPERAAGLWVPVKQEGESDAQGQEGA